MCPLPFQQSHSYSHTQVLCNFMLKVLHIHGVHLRFCSVTSLFFNVAGDTVYHLCSCLIEISQNKRREDWWTVDESGMTLEGRGVPHTKHQLVSRDVPQQGGFVTASNTLSRGVLNQWLSPSRFLSSHERRHKADKPTNPPVQFRFPNVRCDHLICFPCVDSNIFLHKMCKYLSTINKHISSRIKTPRGSTNYMDRRRK